MLANGACHIGNDVFAGGMCDVSDALYVVLGRQIEELPLDRAVQFQFEEEDATSPKTNNTIPLKSHSAYGSPDGQFVLFLHAGASQHYLINTDGGAVTIFESRAKATSVAWHPQMGEVLFVLLESGAVDVYLASKSIAASALQLMSTIPALRLIHGMFAVVAPNPNLAPNGSNSPSKSPRVSSSALHGRRSDSFLPNYSQRTVLNTFNNTAVSRFVAITFIPPVIGQPLLLALATATGDVYAIKLNKSCEPEALSRDIFTEEMNDIFGDRAFDETTLPAASAYVRLLVSNPLSARALSPPLTLNAFIIDVRQGRVALAMLHEDGRVRVYYLWPNDLVSNVPQPAIVPARVACDHELVLCELIAKAGVTKSPVDPATLTSAQQAGNTILYRVEDEMFLVALPIWLRQQHVWALRYDSDCHRGGATVMPLSSTPDLAPAPLAIRIPLVATTYSSAIGTNDLLLLPKYLSGGSQPILVKIEHLLETAMMAMHRKGVRMLQNSASSSSKQPTDAASSSVTTTLHTAIGTVARGCAAFYADNAEREAAIDVAISDAEQLLSKIRDLITAQEAVSNVPKLASLRTSLEATEQKQTSLKAEYQRMLDIATYTEMHKHGVGALMEVNKMLGELHMRLNQLEVVHATDAGRAERAIGVAREIRRSSTIPFDAVSASNTGI